MCHADTYSRHRAGVRATVTSLCGEPPDRNAFPLWDVWALPWTTRGRSVYIACFSGRKPLPKGHTSSMEKHYEHVADEHLLVNSPTVANVMVLATWGLPKSDGTKETRPKKTLKGADGESDDGSPGEAVALGLSENGVPQATYHNAYRKMLQETTSDPKFSSNQREISWVYRMLLST